MKINMKNRLLLKIGTLILGLMLLFTMSCDEDVPPIEDEEEIITDVILTFTSNGNSITASAQDPDGEGPMSIAVSGPVLLSANTTYQLSIKMENSVAGESITEEVEEEADEHMLFFGFTNGLFSNPMGDGNIDQREDAVNYLDEDASGLPLGLLTSWTTGEVGEGTFRIVLKHQPDLKTAESTVNVGSSDIDLTWNVVIE